MLEHIDELIRKAEAIQFELITLSPRLTPHFRRNVETCKDYADDILKALKQEKESKHG